MTAQEAVASALANERVLVVFDADVPYVDLEQKVMHLRPLPDNLTDEAIEDVRSDCDHELGHIRYTDWAPFSAIKRRLVHIIANSVEDGRVERLMAEEWVGCGENLERSGARAVVRIAAGASTELSNQRERAVCGIGLVSYGRAIEATVLALGTDIRFLYKEIWDLLEIAPLAKSTAECVSLAEKIADRWNWRASDARSPEVQAADPIELETREESENAVAESMSQIGTSIAEYRKRVVSSLPSAPADLYRAKTDHDRIEMIRSEKIDPDKILSFFNASIRHVVPPLRRRLLMKFKHLGRRSFRHRRRGDLDERSLHRLALNDDRIFEQRLPAFVQRASVTLLVDCSTSMTNKARDAATPDEPVALRSRLFVAAQAAAALSWALDLLRVRNECLAFTTLRSPVKMKPGFERVRPLRHLIVKPGNRSYHSCRRNFVSLALFEGCSENIDGEAVLWAAQRLLSTTKSDARPVLIVLSDGAPASDPEEHDVLARHLTNSVARIERAGVDVVGVGIGIDADTVRRFYSQVLLVRDVSNLVEQIYVLVDTLLRERTSSGC